MRPDLDEIWRLVPRERTVPGESARRGHLASLASPGERVLDLGCGDGVFVTTLAELGADPVGLDASPVALERAAERARDAELVQADAEAGLPFDDASFDGVWASEMLSQVAASGAVLDHARRVLRPGGWLGVTVPWHGLPADVWTLALRFGRNLDPEHTTLRHYRPATLRRQLAHHGFDRVRSSNSGGVPGLRSAILASAKRPR